MIANLICAVVSIICANSTKVSAPVHAIAIGVIALALSGLGWSSLEVSGIAFLTGLAVFNVVRFVHKKYNQS